MGTRVPLALARGGVVRATFTLLVLAGASISGYAGSSTWNGGTANWSGTSNWTSSPGGYSPNNGNNGENWNATVNSGSVTLDTNVAIQNLTFGGGTITGGSSLTLGGSSTWTGGNFTGSGTTTNQGTLVISPNYYGTLTTTRAILNDGTVQMKVLPSTNAIPFNFGNLNLENTFTNTAGGTFLGNTNDSATIYSYSGTGSFVNQGLISKTGNGTLGLNVKLTNSGTVSVTGGNVSVYNSGTSTGNFNAGAGSQFNVSGGYTFGNGSTVTGDGQFQLSNVNVTGTSAFNSNVAFTSNNVDVKSGGELTLGGTTQFKGATMTGAGSMKLVGSGTWTAGNFTGSGTTTNQGTLVISPGYYGTLTTTRAILNDGTVQMKVLPSTNAIPFNFGNLNLENTFTNTAGGTFLGNTNDSATIYSYSGTGSFVNQGLISKTGNGTLGLNVKLTNTGTVSVTGGGLSIYNSGTSTGNFNADAGTTLSISGGYTLGSGATLTGAGQVTFGTLTIAGNVASTSVANFVGDTVVKSGGGLTLGGTSNFSGGTTTVNSGASALLGGVTNIQGGTLTGSGNIVMSGMGTWSRGVFSGNGQLLNTGTLNLAPVNGSSLALNRTFTNAGEVRTAATSGRLATSSTNFFLNQTGAKFSASNASGLFTVGGNFTSNGTISKTGAGELAFDYLVSNGAIDVEQGVVSHTAGAVYGALNIAAGATFEVDAYGPNGGHGEFGGGFTLTGSGNLKFSADGLTYEKQTQLYGYISGTSLNFPNSNDSYVYVPFPSGRQITFAGHTYYGLHVSTNGVIMFEDPNSGFSNEALPSFNLPQRAIAAFWTDLALGGGRVYVGWQNSETFAVEWSGVQLNGVPSYLDFTVLLKTNGDVQLVYNVLSVPTGFKNFTIGVQAPNDVSGGTDGLTISYNKVLPATEPQYLVHVGQFGATYWNADVNNSSVNAEVAGGFVDFGVDNSFATSGAINVKRGQVWLGDGSSLLTTGTATVSGGDVALGYQGGVSRFGGSRTNVSGGSITGSGTIAGDLFVTAGSIIATDGPGGYGTSLAVSGSASFSSKTSLQLALGGTNPGDSSLLTVSGSLTMGGNLNLIFDNGYEFQVTDSDVLTLLLADAGIGGKFANLIGGDFGNRVVTSDGAGSFALINTGTSVQLTDFARNIDDHVWVPLRKGDLVPDFGYPDNRIAPGAVWTSFGIPSVSPYFYITFVGNFKEGTKSSSGIFNGYPDGPVLVIKKGDPSTHGTFASFRDPAVDSTPNGYQMAFVATMTGPGITGSTNQVLWRYDLSQGTPPVYVAQTGSFAPGAGGAKFQSFTNIAIDSNILAFTASLVSGTGTPVVSGSNSIGLWYQFDGSTPELLVRTGDSLVIGGSSRTITSVKALAARTPATDSGGCLENGFVMANVTMTGGVQAVLQLQSGSTSLIAVTGDQAPGYPAGAKFSTFGIAGQHPLGDPFFRAVLKTGSGGVTSANNEALYYVDIDGTTRRLLVEGTTAAGAGGAVFAGFKDPIADDTGRTFFNGGAGDYTGRYVFAATLAGTNVLPTNKNGLWVEAVTGTDSSTEFLLARQGAEPPGVTGAQFLTTPVSYAMVPQTGNENRSRVWYTAKLASGPMGTPGPGGVTASSDVGLWYAGFDELGVYDHQLVMREGDLVAGKVIKNFTALSQVSKSSGQRHSVPTDPINNPSLVTRITFWDGSQGIGIVSPVLP